MIFLNFASSAAALVIDLPFCTHTLTLRRNRERPESGTYFKIFEITQYLMNTLYICAILEIQKQKQNSLTLTHTCKPTKTCFSRQKTCKRKLLIHFIHYLKGVKIFFFTHLRTQPAHPSFC